MKYKLYIQCIAAELSFELHEVEVRTKVLLQRYHVRIYILHLH